MAAPSSASCGGGAKVDRGYLGLQPDLAQSAEYAEWRRPSDLELPDAPDVGIAFNSAECAYCAPGSGPWKLTISHTCHTSHTARLLVPVRDSCDRCDTSRVPSHGSGEPRAVQMSLLPAWPIPFPSQTLCLRSYRVFPDHNRQGAADQPLDDRSGAGLESASVARLARRRCKSAGRFATRLEKTDRSDAQLAVARQSVAWRCPYR
jgi:hypothetical protein